MKKKILKKFKKFDVKVFTNRRINSIISKNYNPFEVNFKICNRREDDSLMKKNEVPNVTMFVDEKTYQQIKKQMSKTEDYFTEKDFEKISVILA